MQKEPLHERGSHQRRPRIDQSPAQPFGRCCAGAARLRDRRPSAHEAAKRLAANGPNELTEDKRISPFQIWSHHNGILGRLLKTSPLPLTEGLPLVARSTEISVIRRQAEDYILPLIFTKRLCDVFHDTAMCNGAFLNPEGKPQSVPGGQDNLNRIAAEVGSRTRAEAIAEIVPRGEGGGSTPSNSPRPTTLPRAEARSLNPKALRRS